jgi:hypothetical protein
MEVETMSRSGARRLFMVRPSEIFEHPEGMEIERDNIPDGPIGGWEAYAPNWERGPEEIIGPFTPIVSRPCSDGVPVITVQRYENDRWPTEYFFKHWNPGSDDNRPCWYQSGATLRFIRKKS